MEMPISASLTEQILEEMFRRIEGMKEFDEQALQRLRRLAAGGCLDNPEQIVQAIRVTGGSMP
ncbi:MAG: hypothetical protein QXU79_00675 [Candidatus Micrarchaeaceae archaeon]